MDEWYGVVTDSEGRVNWLTLWDNGLKGPIVPDLGNLPALAFLGLGDNELTGEVPVELASATALTALWIENNLLTGAIPSSFLDLSELRVLDFSGNDELCVPGTVRFREWTDAVSLVVGPDCSAADAEILRVFHERTGGGFWTNSDGWLSDAALSEWHGVETDTIGRVTGLGMSSNGLSGELPDSLSELSALVKLDVSGNILAGALPVTLAALDLVELRYSDTRLCVPQEDDFLEWLAGIAQHEGSGRQCPPQDPREILKTFYYATGGDHTWNQSDNWLTDAPLDQWFGVSTDASGNVTRLELDGNFLVGRIPAELGQLTHLVSLNLSWNGLLEGPLPPEFSNLTSLTGLYLQGTDLGGPLPPEIGQLAGLERLYLNSASLTGPLPPELGNLTNLRRLVMGGNYLSGPIPAELGNLTNLTVLNLYYNEHEGRIPPELRTIS